MYHVTYHGLHEWSTAMFEKLGWMVLAKEHGHKEKIPHYKHGIQHFLVAVDELIATTVDEDRKRDLGVLKTNMLVLQKKVNTMFK
jgi:hypothetical protein